MTLQVGGNFEKKKAGLNIINKTTTNQRSPSSALGVVKKVIPSGSIRRIKGGAVTTVGRVRMPRALDPMVKPWEPTERGPE